MPTLLKYPTLIFKNHQFFILCGLITSAFLIRYYTLTTLQPLFLGSDEAIYMSLARKFFQTNLQAILHPWWSPLYPIISSFTYIFIPDLGLAGRVTSLFFGTLLVIPVFFLAQNIGGKISGILAGLLVVFSKPLVYSSTQSLTEAQMTFFIWTAFLLTILSIQKQNKKIGFIAGFTWALAALSKGEGFLLFLSFLATQLIITIYLLIKKHRNKITLKPPLSILGFILIGFALAFAPYQVAMSLKYNKSTFVAKLSAASNLYNSFALNKEQSSTWAQDIFSIETYNINSQYNTGFLTNFTKNSRQWFDDTFTRIKISINKFFIPTFTVYGFILSFVGILASLTIYKKYQALLLFLPTFFGMYIVMFFAPGSEMRYVYWVIPAISIGIAISSNLYRKNLLVKLLLTLFVLVLIFSGLGFHSPTQLKNSIYFSPISTRTYPQDQWLLDNDPNQKVMMRYENYGIYSNSFVIYTPLINTLSDLVKYAQLWDAKYLIVDPGQVNPQLDYLYNDPKDYSNLSLVLKDENNKGRLYKFVYSK